MLANQYLGKSKSGCSLGDFLIFGNMDRLELCDDLGKIYVDYRVDSLVECFAPLTGLKKHFDSMVDFLEDCASQYRLLLDHVTEEIGTNSDVPMSLFKFAKDRCRALAVPLKRSIRLICTHLPKRLILPDNFEKLVTLCGLLESFEILLSQSQVADKELEELFAQRSRAFNYISATLHKMRIESVQVSDAADFGSSLFERLGLFGHSEDVLNMQYRMHPEISSFPNRKFYKDHIIDAPSVLCENFEKNYIPGPTSGPYSFLNISNGREEPDEAGHSIKNMVEVAVVMAIVRKLYKGMTIMSILFSVLVSTMVTANLYHRCEMQFMSHYSQFVKS
ncbi:hypothetical protein MKX03_031403 [Papaver bracteatum]|nr:hypothetical protein MKX03_031403 [Papaver bracteatum]